MSDVRARAGLDRNREMEFRVEYGRILIIFARTLAITLGGCEDEPMSIAYVQV